MPPLDDGLPGHPTRDVVQHVAHKNARANSEAFSTSVVEEELSQGMEGGIANFERTLDGYLAGLSDDELAPALREVNVNPLERPVVDLGF